MSAATVRTSVPELRRMAPDALRMAGLPLGQADETADLLVWTEVVTGGALRFLRVNRARLLWSPRPRPVVTHAAPGSAHVDARGGSLLELGIRIADFARGEAVGGPGATVTVSHTYGSVFLPYLVWRCGRYGYAASVTARDPRGGDLRHDPDERRAEVRLELSAAAPPPEPPRLNDPGAAPESFLTALAHGLDVDADDFAAYTELFEMLRVPTSERSRTHAG